MAPTEIHGTLAETPLFAALTADEIDRIVDVGRVEYWQEDTDVLEEGTWGPRLMVILEGRVVVLRRDAKGIQRAIAELGEGEVLGEMGLLLDLPRTATVRATEALRVFAMDRNAFQALVNDGDQAALKFGLELSRVMARRIVSLNKRVVQLLADADVGLRDEFSQARQEIFALWDDEP